MDKPVRVCGNWCSEIIGIYKNIAGQTSEQLKLMVSKLATAPDLPASDFHIIAPCRALERWAIPSHTFTLEFLLACPSGAAG
jgi:hypothetical protein